MKEIISPVETRQKIIQTALAIAAKKGFGCATTKEIAKQAKVSEGIIYHYFKSKQDLCYAGISEYAAELRRQATRAIEPVKSAREKLEALIEFHVDYFTREGNIFQILFGKSGQHPLMMGYILKEAIIPYAMIVAGIVQQGIQEKGFKKMDVEAAGASILGMLQLNMIRWHFSSKKTNCQEIKDTVKVIIFKGISKN